jgi:dipeptidyl aminopeptidase/acylaminoacyl peptidase
MIETAYYNKPILPRFVLKVILKYHLRTDKWIADAKCPLFLFHGTEDRLIPYSQSEMLMNKLAEAEIESTLYTLEGHGHDAVHRHETYVNEIERLLK